MSGFLLIPRIEVHNANAQPAFWIVGAPPPTAFHGFAYALGLAINAKQNGVCIIHHDIEFLGEVFYGQLHPHQFRAAGLIDKDDYSSRNAHVLSSQPTARCNIIASLAICFNDEEVEKVSMNAVERFLSGARLAGGSIIEHEKIVFETDPEKIKRHIHTGWALHERQDLMVRQPDDRDYLDVVLRVTRKERERNPDHDFVMPTTLGYRTITPIEQRVNARKGLPHAYAEPLVGLVQYKAVRDGGLPVWIAKHDAVTQIFVVTAPTAM
ncbi:CRISPR-associated protein Csy2 [Gammaproteobacteria bacterium]